MSVQHFDWVATASAALRRRIRRHRQAFLAYDRLVPLGDDLDVRFSPDSLIELDRWQSLEARRRRDLLAHPVRSMADMVVKATYLLTYPGSDFLLSGPDDWAVLLNSMGPNAKLGHSDKLGTGDEKQSV